MEKHGARPSPGKTATRYARPGAGDSVVGGLMLAGGDGKRLKSFIRAVRKDPLPKQFVNFIGRSMQERTIDRAQRFIPSRILDVLRRTGRLTRLNGWSKSKPSRVYRTPPGLSPDTLAPRAKEFASQRASEESLLS